jgi:hypothetical protein
MRPVANRNYRHYKGGIYRVVNTGTYTEDKDHPMLTGLKMLGVGKFTEGNNEQLVAFMDEAGDVWITPPESIENYRALKKLRDKPMVVYFDEHNDLWFRPLSMWNEDVEYMGKKRPRYTLMGVHERGISKPVFGGSRMALPQRQRI